MSGRRPPSLCLPASPRPQPGPQPLPGTLGVFPHPCPSVDALPPSPVFLPPISLGRTSLSVYPRGPQAPSSVPFCGLKFRNKILSKKHWVLPEASEGTRAQQNACRVVRRLGKRPLLGWAWLESQGSILKFDLGSSSVFQPRAQQDDTGISLRKT